MQDFKKLQVWQRARYLTRAVYELSADLPPSEQFSLQSQMRRASISVCSNIAEGRGRRGDREFRRFLIVAMGSACELESELILVVDLKFVGERQQSAVLAQLIEVKRMLSGLIEQLSPRPRSSQLLADG